uniref:Choline/glycine/proline betaine transport protein n=1 Tax=Candidatus Kentrum sp. FM TaxID=2126340 RepID=A0A450VRD2_9GAMM|nr:MAG: choline/glycine/proline betaine transport protein [Candidatus Kentron sp. FM]VFJ43934.1 MAG: choline/glycine/proline betaine transport protein [Candidatus Kentron sp. FM]VFK07336.1 MAG: choline/glycine/proline betaine transport protein [Candidatus Kentron sp. FM]
MPVTEFKRGLLLKGNPIVFFGSAGMILVFAVFGTFFTETAQVVFDNIKTTISSQYGMWFYHASITFCLFFCFWLCVSRYGRIRLGADDERPKYSYISWFSMLFSAGMGIGVLFWAVAEPITHFTHPPVGVAGTPEAARLAMDLSLLHWGLHGWAVYAIAGLGLAYVAYRRQQPLTFRSILYPIFGERIRGPIGHAIDIFAVLGTMFGVATTLGLGAQQLNAGLHHLLDTDISTALQVLLIVGITVMATISVVSGLDRGILLLSRLAVWLAFPLVLFLLFVEPVLDTLWSVAESTGHYLFTVGKQGFWPDFGGSAQWQGNWTIFYWAWWIAWSPFVGMFVARISRGRTIREFVLGVLFVPTLVTCIWFGLFGGIGLDSVINGNEGLANAVQENFAVSIFVFFDALPGTVLLSLVGVLIIVIFFVTSSDSASLVIDYITAGGDSNPPKRQRVFWAITEGVVAAVLLVSGGIAPMQTFQLITGLPLAVILLLICYAIVLLLRGERHAVRG